MWKRLDRKILRPLTILAGVLLLLMPWLTGRFDAAGAWLGAVLFVLGAATLVHCAFSFRPISKMRPGKTLTIRTESGESVIAIEALEGIIRDEVVKAGDVRDVGVDLTVSADDQHIDCELRFKLDNQPDIPARVEMHRQTVRETFGRLIPGDLTLEVSCRVEDIIVADRARQQREAQSSSDERAFSGPVYPVPGEGESGQGY
jgi:hypothetical protein